MSTTDLNALPMILVVDDSNFVRVLLRQFLEGEGYQVAEAKDGASALAQLQHQPFDLVILDIVMPGMDGKMVCARIQECIPEPPPVLVMTAMDYDEEVDQVYNAGAVDYVRKPLKWRVLRNRIRYILKAHRSSRELSILSKKYEMILDFAENGISGLDREGNISYINQAGQRLLGYRAEEALGKNCREIFRIARSGSNSFNEDCCPFVNPEYKKAVVRFDEIRIERRDGTTFPADLRATPIIQDGQLTGGVVVFQDITERQKAAQIIRHMASHDALTNLPNRNFLLQRVPQAISLATRQSRRLFLLFIDLDRFKPINDQYGHSVGDIVLVQVGKRLSRTMRASDSVCRLGGDEFVVLLESAATLAGAIMVAERIIELLNEPIQIKDLSCSIGASIGIAVFPDDSEDTETLLRHADQAMYAAKKKGRNCWHLYGDQVKSQER
ncbi:MAG: diguanylate cyclase [Desulfobulbaceae bacterium]|nr:diguanylate cyclase [Desulfobulbaceae bacterium]